MNKPENKVGEQQELVVTKGSGNVFADLGLPEAEALNEKAKQLAKSEPLSGVQGIEFDPDKVERWADENAVEHHIYLEVVTASDYDALLALHKASLERERVLQVQYDSIHEQFRFWQGAEAKSFQRAEAAESQLRELREIVKIYRDGSHPLCLKAVKYPDGLMDDRCSTCKAADLFLEKSEGK